MTTGRKLIEFKCSTCILRGIKHISKTFEEHCKHIREFHEVICDQCGAYIDVTHIEGHKKAFHPASESEQKCENCKFWGSAPGIKHGLCRRYPPVPFPKKSSITVYWPPTEPLFWCGEWKAK